MQRNGIQDKQSNILTFPRTIEHMNRDMDKIVDQSIDILERSEALLRWAKETS
jgi:hypothetical protein